MNKISYYKLCQIFSSMVQELIHVYILFNKFFDQLITLGALISGHFGNTTDYLIAKRLSNVACLRRDTLKRRVVFRKERLPQVSGESNL